MTLDPSKPFPIDFAEVLERPEAAARRVGRILLAAGKPPAEVDALCGRLLAADGPEAFARELRDGTRGALDVGPEGKSKIRKPKKRRWRV